MTSSTSGSAYDGARCTAADGMGNRCHKLAAHASAGGAGSERRHDASRGDVRRLWS